MAGIISNSTIMWPSLLDVNDLGQLASDQNSISDLSVNLAMLESLVPIRTLKLSNIGPV